MLIEIIKETERIKEGYKKRLSEQMISITVGNDRKEFKERDIKILCEETKEDRTNSIGMSESEGDSPSVEKDSPQKAIIEKLIEHFELNPAVVKEDVEILSNDDYYLSLPWEEVLDKANCFIRYIKGCSALTSENKHLNLFYIFANFENDDIKSLERGLQEEWQKIINNIIGKDIYQTRASRIIQVLRNVTLELLENSNFKPFSIIHFSTHGEVHRIGICGDERKKTFETCDVSELIKIIKKKTDQVFPKNLIFLSCCHSADFNYELEQNCSCYEFIENGVAGCSIGYNGPIENNNAAPSFSNDFYSKYLLDESLLNSYKFAYERNKNKEHKYKRSPRIYFSESLRK